MGSFEHGSQHKPEPIAIVGMGCRWPGSVGDVPGLWELLANRGTGYGEFDAPRFSAKGFYHPNADRPGTMATRGAYLVDEDPRLFDPTFFGMTGLEAENMDPSQRKLLEVVYEAFENAGETWQSVAGSNIGVFVGNFSFDHLVTQARDWDRPRPYALTGASSSILSNRISYIFNLHGPSLALDTACSSSMYAVYAAVSAIRNGDCDSAIVAASNWIMDPGLQMALDKLGALSATSTCHTFGAEADGYARGEGFAALYLTKPSLAISRSLPIRTLIRGVAVNANGRTGGITRPSAAGQEAVIRKAYQNAGNLPFSDTAYFEVHGTGTAVGDPIEVEAVGNVFSSHKSDSLDDRLLLGAVKPQLGHTEGGSALAAIMKVVLSIEHGLIPPTITDDALNPHIDFTRLEVVTELRPWPKGRLKRASINSFGFGGANGHVILDHVSTIFPGYEKPGIVNTVESKASNGHGSHANGHSPVTNGNGVTAHRHPPTINGNGVTASGDCHHYVDSPQKDTLAYVSKTTPDSSVVATPTASPKADAKTRQYVLLPFSGHNEASLNKNIEALSKTIDKHSLADVAYTLAARRSKFGRRTFRIVEQNDSYEDMLKGKKVFSSSTKIASIGYIFTGQGAQWHGMGAQLLEYHTFQNTIRYLDSVLGVMDPSPSWAIEDVLAGRCDSALIYNPLVTQTACTAVQVALVDLLASWSIRPSGVVGHSSGEMAAAYAAGYISSGEAITATYFRGLAVSNNKRDGSMVAVSLNVEQAKALISVTDAIKIAAINSPNSVTLSGDTAAIAQLCTVLEADGIFHRLLRTGGNAYHSHHMAALGSEYMEKLSSGSKQLKQRQNNATVKLYPRVPWISSVTPTKTMPDEISASYWRANLESPVRFSDAVAALISSDASSIDVLLEIGPHGSLSSPLDQIMKSVSKSLAYASSLKRNEDGRVSMLQLAGSLFCYNAGVDISLVNALDDVVGDSHKLVHGCLAVDLPPYQHSYRPVSYLEGRASKEYRLRSVPRHDILGSKVPGNAKLRPQWRNILRLKDLPWLGGHRLLPNIVFPAAGYFTMAMVAASEFQCDTLGNPTIDGFSIKNVTIKSALRIPEDDYGIEVMFSLECPDIARSDSPTWCSFSISSVILDSKDWTEHCTGFIKIETDAVEDIERLLPQSFSGRRADSSAWYRTFSDIGLGYGDAFQGLSEIVANPQHRQAAAVVSLNTTIGTIKGGESKYPIHPSSLDSIIQLGLIACYGGQIHKAKTAFVPVHLSQLYIKKDVSGNSAKAFAQGGLRGLRGAYTKLQMVASTNELVLHVDGLRHISYNSGFDSGRHVAMTAYSSPFTRMVWKPDVRALQGEDCRRLIPTPSHVSDRISVLRGFDQLAALIVIDLYEAHVKSLKSSPCQENLAYFAGWIQRQAESSQDSEINHARGLSISQRQEKIRLLYVEFGQVVEVQLVKRIHEGFPDILAGRRTGVDILVPDGLLTAFYETGIFMTGAYPQMSALLDLLGHANPNQKIIELGAGTGGATRIAMKALNGANGIKRYGSYTFTDISPGFLTAAQKSFSEYKDIDYAVLNIEEDPRQQDMEPKYDLVLASQILHATSSISNTLQNCKKLLRPGGKLLLIENTINNPLLGIILGSLTGYWHGVPDGRTEGPFIALSAWKKQLREAGFSGTEIVLDDNPRPYTIANTILSTSLESKFQNHTNGESESPLVYCLYSETQKPTLLSHLFRTFTARGIESHAASLDGNLENIPSNCHVIAFLRGSDLLQIKETALGRLQTLFKRAKSMMWLTSCGIVKGRDPSGAISTGLLRTLGSENPSLRFRSLDIDANDFDIENSNLTNFIVEQEILVQSNSPIDEQLSQDREFVWQDGCIWVSRLVPDEGFEPTYGNEQRSLEIKTIDNSGPVCASFATPGLLSSLYFKPYAQLWQPLPADWIDVKVTAIGLNWKDLGLASGKFDANNLSSEYTGMVQKIGADVHHLSVGDPVYGMGRGHFGNFTRVPAAAAHKLQVRDNIVEMATMPLVFMTAIYAFEHITRLKKEDTVLIQSATGGLGLAAIQIARMKGAEIFVSVGTEKKAQYLREVLKFDESHVLYPSDIPRVANLTLKKGFDVILSTSKGDTLYASIKALAPLGRLIDVGRMDVQDSKTIGLELFQKSAHFSSFDLTLVLDSDPEIGRRLISSVDAYYRAGHIEPIRPHTPWDISELDQALLSFSKGSHIGKLVITFQNPSSVVKMARTVSVAQFDPRASYVVTGGFSGLGLSIMEWMSNRGAHHFVVISRSGVDKEGAQEALEDFQHRGIQIQAIKCDISKQESVMNALAESKFPIKGVIHAAVSYQDVSFDKLSFDQWTEGFAAKVHGTLNLHTATNKLPLDFFVMPTSVEPIFAPATQSVYTAGNSFQDYFARFRRRQGLPASTVSFGLIRDLGHLSGNTHASELFARNKVLSINESQFLDLLEPAFFNNEPPTSQSRYIGKDHDPLSSANLVTCMDPAVMASNALREAETGGSSLVRPRWYSDGRVSIVMRAMEDAQHQQNTTDASRREENAGGQSAAATLRQKFLKAAKAGPEERVNALGLVKEGIATAMAEMLFMDRTSVDSGKSVAEHGVDSLIAAELRNWFLTALDFNIAMLDLLDARTSIDLLAAEIVEETSSQKA